MLIREVVFRVRVVRDVSWVPSCAREMCLRFRGVFRMRVLLLPRWSLTLPRDVQGLSVELHCTFACVLDMCFQSLL